MKFFADENVALLIVQWLRQMGHDVLYAAEADPGQDDAIWLHRAEQSERLIVTADKDFGDLIFRDRLNSHGVVLMRMPGWRRWTGMSASASTQTSAMVRRVSRGQE
jgi:predicted nuclease of predicted toxin-antitoxin system